MHMFSRLILAFIASGSILLARKAIRHQKYIQAASSSAQMAQSQRHVPHPPITAWVPWHLAAQAPGAAVSWPAGGHWSGLAEYLRNTRLAHKHQRSW